MYVIVQSDLKKINSPLEDEKTFGHIIPKQTLLFALIVYIQYTFLQIRLPNHVGYILEYLVRFVIRLHLNPQQVECLMMRFVASLTHQCVDILGECF